MKVLFLDVDGVLNASSTTDFRTHLYPIDPYMAFLVGRIQLETACEVVLSSAWRYHPDGIKSVEKACVKLLDITPMLYADVRGAEIKKWLDEHPKVKKYAILDDNSDMLDEQLPNFFKTTFEAGLTDEIAERVIEHLGRV